MSECAEELKSLARRLVKTPDMVGMRGGKQIGTIPGGQQITVRIPFRDLTKVYPREELNSALNELGNDFSDLGITGRLEGDEEITVFSGTMSNDGYHKYQKSLLDAKLERLVEYLECSAREFRSKQSQPSEWEGFSEWAEQFVSQEVKDPWAFENSLPLQRHRKIET